MRQIYGWLLAALVLLPACSRREAPAPFVRSVELTRPAALADEVVQTYPGVVRAAHEVNLGFKTAGQLRRLHVREGDFVRRGQLLAELDDADYRLAVEALQIQYDQLADEVARTRQLFEQHGVSANDYEKATAGLRQLGVQLQAKRNQLAYTRLSAPADGWIQSVRFAAAEMVNAGTPVFTLLDVSRLEVEADLPAEAYRQRAAFRGYACRAAASGTTWPLKLLSFTPKADGNQLYRLRLTFDGRPPRQLTAGMNVAVAVRVADTAAVRGYTLPLSAVFHAQGQPCVWVLRPDSTVTRRVVRLSPDVSEGRAVVTGGLEGNERVVRAGAATLQEGEHVRVLDRPARTNVGGLL